MLFFHSSNAFYIKIKLKKYFKNANCEFYEQFSCRKRMLLIQSLWVECKVCLSHAGDLRWQNLFLVLVQSAIKVLAGNSVSQNAARSVIFVFREKSAFSIWSPFLSSFFFATYQRYHQGGRFTQQSLSFLVDGIYLFSAWSCQPVEIFHKISLYAWIKILHGRTQHLPSCLLKQEPNHFVSPLF